MRLGGRPRAAAILEAFKPGTAPPDSYSVIGVSGDPNGASGGRSPNSRGRGLTEPSGGNRLNWRRHDLWLGETLRPVPLPWV